MHRARLCMEDDASHSCSRGRLWYLNNLQVCFVFFRILFWAWCVDIRFMHRAWMSVWNIKGQIVLFSWQVVRVRHFARVLYWTCVLIFFDWHDVTQDSCTERERVWKTMRQIAFSHRTNSKFYSWFLHHAKSHEGSGTSPSDESQECHEVNMLAARRAGKSHWRQIKAVGMKGACEISGFDLAWKDRAWRERASGGVEGREGQKVNTVAGKNDQESHSGRQ